MKSSSLLPPLSDGALFLLLTTYRLRVRNLRLLCVNAEKYSFRRLILMQRVLSLVMHRLSRWIRWTSCCKQALNGSNLAFIGGNDENPALDLSINRWDAARVASNGSVFPIIVHPVFQLQNVFDGHCLLADRKCHWHTDCPPTAPQTGPFYRIGAYRLFCVCYPAK